MTQQKRSIDVAKSKDSISTATIAGVVLGDKASARKVKRSILNTGQRTYSKTITSWYCQSCADKAKDTENSGGVVALIGGIVVCVIAFAMWPNNDIDATSVDQSIRADNSPSANLLVEDTTQELIAPQTQEVIVSSSSPSFDCAQAKLPAELTICASPELSRADALLGESYDYTRSVVPPEIARQLARELHADTMSCENDVTCLSRELQKSVREIQNLGAVEEASLSDTFNSLSIEERMLVQTVLSQEGFYNSEIDGEWGPITRNAVYRFTLSSFMATPPPSNTTPENIIYNLAKNDR